MSTSSLKGRHLSAVAAILLISLALGCAASSSRPDHQKDKPLLKPPSEAPRHSTLKEAPISASSLTPRALRMVDGLKKIISQLEASQITPNTAFDLLRKLEETVGPPQISLPPHKDACHKDSDCALTDLQIEGPQNALCCPSLRKSAGTVAWVRLLEKTCKSYEPFRVFIRRPILLPSCGMVTGPSSANVALCRSGRCRPCMTPTDKSPIYCHEPSPAR